VRPTQLYLSLNAPDRELYHRVSQPEEDLWDNVLESLSLLAGHPSRTVVRLTLARGLNMTDPQGYARLLEISEPDFVEVKAYMHLGRSRLRLERSSMPSHSEVMEFSRDLEEHLSYRLVDHVPLSRVALLSKGSKSQLISLE
jgi:tRNA wybutosine-synthesizing protein 1